MNARWERLPSPSSPSGPLLMDAVLTPNRSLSKQAFRLVIGSFALVNAAVAIVFLLHGAYPVTGFMGLDVLALAWAFKASYRSGRAVERVRITQETVEVSRQPPDKAEVAWAVSPLWVRVHDDPKAVRMAAGGRSVMVGGFLSPPERATLADAVRAALLKARGR